MIVSYVLPIFIATGLGYYPMLLAADIPTTGWEKMGFTGALIAAIIVLWKAFIDLTKRLEEMQQVSTKTGNDFINSNNRSNQILAEINDKLAARERREIEEHYLRSNNQMIDTARVHLEQTVKTQSNLSSQSKRNRPTQ